MVTPGGKDSPLGKDRAVGNVRIDDGAAGIRVVKPDGSGIADGIDT